MPTYRRNRHLSNRAQIAAGVFLLAAGAATATPLLAGAEDTSSPPNNSESTSVNSATPGVRVALLDRGSETGGTASSEISKLRDIAANNGKGPATLNNRGATVRVPRANTSGSLAVVDDQNGTCLLLSGEYGSSYGCGPGLKKAPMLGSLDVVDAEHWRVAFLLPDGVETFNITLRDGTIKTLPVNENIIDTVIGGGGPSGFTWREANGRERHIAAAPPEGPK